MNKKFSKLIKKNNLSREVYSHEVNSKVNRKYKYGEENAIIRKALNSVIDELERLGMDTSIFTEFKEYYDYVESEKVKVKESF